MSEEELDLDAILEGHSSDGDEDGAEEEALERRLQEILNATEEGEKEEATPTIHGSAESSVLNASMSSPDGFASPALGLHSDALSMSTHEVSKSKEVQWITEGALSFQGPNVHTSSLQFGSSREALQTSSISTSSIIGSSRPGAAIAAAALASRQAVIPERSQQDSLLNPKWPSIEQPYRDAPVPSEDLPVAVAAVASSSEVKDSSGIDQFPESDDDEFILVDTNPATQTEGLKENTQNKAHENENDNFQLEESVSLFSAASNSMIDDSKPGSDGGLLMDDFQALSSESDLNEGSIVSILSEEEVGTMRESIDAEIGSLTETPKNLLPTQLDNRSSGMDESRSMGNKSALDIAEDAEKSTAFSGLHIEEGAAAQPMRLEGIQTGPPPIGYLHIDSVGSVSDALSSSSNSRDHGTGQALAVHNNAVAVGLSKGSVLLAPLKTNAPKSGDLNEPKMAFLSSTEKTHASVTSMSFSNQGDLLLVGHANGSLVLWDVPRAVIVKVLNVEHSVAVLHTAFLGQDAQFTRSTKAVSGDCKGLVLLHTFAFSPYLKRFSVETKCLVDGQNTATVLCLSPLLWDSGSDDPTSPNVVVPSKTAISTGLSSMVGGMVGGVVAAGKSPDSGKKLMTEGVSAEEAGGVIVFVTHQTILVVRLAPSVEVCAKLSRPDGIREGGIPYVAWRRVHTQLGLHSRGSSMVSINAPAMNSTQLDSKKNIDEEGIDDRQVMLALAWDKKVFVLQLLKGELKIVADWDLDTVACGIAWLEEQMVVVLTAKEQLCLFTKEGVEVERGPIDSGESRRSSAISYHTHILNSFGNPEKTYHNSLVARGATLYLLEPWRLWRARLLPWQDRIKALQNAGDWMGAFHVGMEVYDGRALGVIGLPKKMDQLQVAVTPVLLDLLFAYIDEVFTYLSLSFASFPSTEIKGTGDLGSSQDFTLQVKEQYTRVGGVAIEFCVHIRQTDVLFDRVFNKFCGAGQRGVFLELLEPYILKDTLGGLAPEVMQALVEYYSQKGWVQRVEQCVLHMDIASLDFNQVVRLCRDNGLYSALIYVFNKGLDDFRSPLEELLAVAQDPTKTNTRVLGYKMLVYLKYCFLGLAFPPGHGHIPSSRLLRLRTELLMCLLDNKPVLTSGAVEEHPSQNMVIHPRLSYLLSFDLTATLEVLRCAFAEDGPLGANCNNDALQEPEDSGSFHVVKTREQLLQDIVDALLDIIEWVRLRSVNESDPRYVDSKNTRISRSCMGLMMEFIAEYVASNQAKVARAVLARIIRHLAFADTIEEFPIAEKDENARRKEKLLVRLVNGVPESEWDSSQTLEFALRAQFWEASACLLAREGDYVAALDSHLKDRDQPQNAFVFILNILDSTRNLTERTLSEFRSSVLARLPQLLQLSSESTLVIMLKHFSKEHKHILADLAPYPPLLFQYLKQIMNARSGFKYGTFRTKIAPEEASNATTDEIEGGDEIDKVCSSLIGHDNLQELLKNAGLEFTNEMEELFVELLCQFDPKSVLKFLKCFEDYRLEHCLKLCQDYGITDAAAYLFERVGDVGSALSLVVADMDSHIHNMDLSISRLLVKQSNLETDDSKKLQLILKIPEVAATCSVMQVAIELCQRNTWRMYPGESEALWFRLLDRFVDPLRKLHNAKKDFRRSNVRVSVDSKGTVKKGTEATYTWKVVMIGRMAVDLMQRVLVYLMGEIINGMMGYIPLSAIMDKLLSENGNHEFGDFKCTILDMLGSYGYEQTILFTAKHVVEDDMFHNLSLYKKKSSRGFAPNKSVCCICNHRLDKDSGSRESIGAPPKWRASKVFTEGIGKHGKPQDTKGTPRTSTAAVVVFFCGHAAHCSCILTDVGATSSKTDLRSANCPICPRKLSLSDSMSRKHKFMQGA